MRPRPTPWSAPSTADITRGQNEAGESALGGVLADAHLAATSSPDTGNAVVAFMNPGGIRDNITFASSGPEADGELTYGEAFSVHPFGNSMVTMTLTGAQIDTLLEQQFREEGGATEICSSRQRGSATPGTQPLRWGPRWNCPAFP